MPANEITVPARGHSHGSAAPKTGTKNKPHPVGYIKVNAGVWRAALLIA